LHSVHLLPKWQDHCYRASRDLC